MRELLSKRNSVKAYKEDIPFLLFSRAPSRTGCKLEIVENAKQYRELLKLRKKIFVDQEGYPFDGVRNGFERESVHILARMENRYIGMISVKLDDINGLPIEKHIDLSEFSKKRIAEFDKLGVLDTLSENTQRAIFYELVGAAYGLVRFCGYNTLVIFTLARKLGNIAIYEKMGFEQIGQFEVFPNALAVAMSLDLDTANGLMWKTSQLVKLAKRLVFSIHNNIS